MAYVPVPKDLSKVKTKVAFNLTKRQILCFSVALLMGLPLFFLFKDSAGTSLAAMAMIVVMLPCFLVAIAVISSQLCNDTLEDYFKKITGGEGIA